jgi:tRNA(fMet)-specific endonuclease VapC
VSYLFDTNACIHLMKLQRTRADQELFLAPFRVFDFDSAAADCYAGIRAHLSMKGKLIGDRDLMIAAIAQANRRIVITSNVSELARVPGLNVQDWMA